MSISVSVKDYSGKNIFVLEKRIQESENDLVFQKNALPISVSEKKKHFHSPTDDIESSDCREIIGIGALYINELLKALFGAVMLAQSDDENLVNAILCASEKIT